MEAFGASACDTDDEESDSCDDDDESCDEDDKGSQPSSKWLSAKAPDADGGPGDDDMHDAADEDDSDPDDVVDVDHIGGASAVSDEAKRSIDLAAARRLLYDEAVRKRDDNRLRTVRKRMREEAATQKDASSEVGKLLLKRANEQRAEEIKDRQEAHKEERLAAKNLEEAKLTTAKTQQVVAEVRLAQLRQIVLNRRDAEARKQADALEKKIQLWLQTHYPAQLARSCMNKYRRLKSADKTRFERVMNNLLVSRSFLRQVLIMNLWEVNRSLTLD